MLCSKCNCECKEEDFFGLWCYKCLFAEKKAKSGSNVSKCKGCGGVLPSNKWKYCSDECANASMKLKNKTHWTRCITIDKVKW